MPLVPKAQSPYARHHKFTGTHLYTRVHVDRGTVRVNYLFQEHNAMSRPGLELEPFVPLTSALTMKLSRLQAY